MQALLSCLRRIGFPPATHGTTDSSGRPLTRSFRDPVAVSRLLAAIFWVSVDSLSAAWAFPGWRFLRMNTAASIGEAPQASGIKTPAGDEVGVFPKNWS